MAKTSKTLSLTRLGDQQNDISSGKRRLKSLFFFFGNKINISFSNIIFFLTLYGSNATCRIVLLLNKLFIGTKYMWIIKRNRIKWITNSGIKSHLRHGHICCCSAKFPQFPQRTRSSNKCFSCLSFTRELLGLKVTSVRALLYTSLNY